MTTSVPEVLWAQRSSADEPEKNVIFLSINAYDCDPASIKLDIQPTKITFTGTSKARTFHVELELYAEIDPAHSKSSLSARGADLTLRKKEAKQEFWPRLLKESKKQHFLKTDFGKWVDEDEQEEAAEDPMAGMGGMGGPPGGGDFGDMGGGMGGMGGGMGGIDFSKLGGMGGGMGGMDMEAMMAGMGGGMGGMGGMGAGDDDDDDMPELEGGDVEDTTTAAKAAADKPKIEELSDSK